MLKYILVFTFFLASVEIDYAQVKQSDRFELEKKNTDDYFTVLSAGKNGLIIFRDTEEFDKEKGGDVWEVTAIDTAMNQLWKQEFGIENKYSIKAYELAESKLYFLFKEGDYGKSDYRLVTFSVLDGVMEDYEIENELELELTNMIVSGGKVILGGYVRFSPTLLMYTLGNESFEVIPGYFKDKGHIMDIKCNEGGLFNSITLEKDYESDFLRFRTYGGNREILFERLIPGDSKYKLLSAKSTSFVNGNVAITGTYTGFNSVIAMGVYFIIVKPEGQDNIVKYYPFSKFEHFFDYMNPKRAKKIEEKIQIKEAAGKDFRFGSRLVLHKAGKADDGFMILGEIYRPKYDNVGRPELTSYNMGYGYNHSASSRANTKYVKQVPGLPHAEVANAYDYKQALVFKLDNNGELQWDNSFKIEDVETFSLEQVVDVSVGNENLNMIYYFDDELRYKTVNEDSVTSEGRSDLKLTHENDVIKHDYDGVGNTVHWYDNTFFIWGYHKIENRVNQNLDKRRDVLFINKVLFE